MTNFTNVNKQRVAQGQEEKPFFMYMAFTHMHVPIFHNPSYTNSSGRGHYGDALRELDYHIGRVVEALDTLGIADNTMITLTGDNGAPSDQCQYGGSNGPFLGTWMRLNGGGGTGKITTWEGGHREVSIITWPGKIPPGRVSAALTSTVDYFPTFAALSGKPLPPDRMYDGMDLSPILFDGSNDGHETLFHPNVGEGPIGALETLRVGRRFKAKYRTGKVGGCQSPAAPSLHHDPPLIFDMDTDWGEAFPLQPSHPDYQQALNLTRAALIEIAASLAKDNTSVADYSTDPTCTPEHCIKPCCNPRHPLCVCEDQV
eukprot:m.6501 g.6501  ORF g.6501 m.6501 type:complete len:315 (+) comp6095_c0_seq1:3-947(+)